MIKPNGPLDLNRSYWLGPYPVDLYGWLPLSGKYEVYIQFSARAGRVYKVIAPCLLSDKRRCFLSGEQWAWLVGSVPLRQMALPGFERAA